jgi:DNA-binding MarR family transcriptional regulator
MTENITKNPINASTLADATEAWLSVVQAYNECSATLSYHLSPLGFSLLEHEVLMNLLRFDRSTQRELSQRCYSAKSGISMLISRFERDGLIERHPSLKDKRAWCLSLTPKGQFLAQDALAVQNKVVAQMAKAFSTSDLTIITTGMTAASTILENMRS